MSDDSSCTGKCDSLISHSVISLEWARCWVGDPAGHERDVGWQTTDLTCKATTDSPWFAQSWIAYATVVAHDGWEFLPSQYPDLPRVAVDPSRYPVTVYHDLGIKMAGAVFAADLLTHPYRAPTRLTLENDADHPVSLMAPFDLWPITIQATADVRFTLHEQIALDPAAIRASNQGSDIAATRITIDKATASVGKNHTKTFYLPVARDGSPIAAQFVIGGKALDTTFVGPGVYVAGPSGVQHQD